MCVCVCVCVFTNNLGHKSGIKQIQNNLYNKNKKNEHTAKIQTLPHEAEIYKTRLSISLWKYNLKKKNEQTRIPNLKLFADLFI